MSKKYHMAGRLGAWKQVCKANCSQEYNTQERMKMLYYSYKNFNWKIIDFSIYQKDY